MNKDTGIWKFPPFYERNRIVEYTSASAPGAAAQATFHLEFEDGRGLTADGSLLPELLRVMGLERPEDLAGIEVEVTTEPLHGYAQLQSNVYVYPTSRTVV